MLDSSAVRSLAYVAFFLSGASSLIFQNIWSRMLHHVFGATSVAVSTVVSVFMAGLGLGAWIAGRYADRIKHPLITYAFVELTVGCWAIAIPTWVDAGGWLVQANQLLRATFGPDSFGFMVGRFALVLPVLLVPTTLMGATLPLLARHFVAQQSSSGAAASRVGTLYAINTFGAVAGIELGAFVLLPQVGLALTNMTAIGLNFMLGLGIFVFRRPLLHGLWETGEPLRWWPGRKTAVQSEPSPVVDSQTSESADPPAGLTSPFPPVVRRLSLGVFAVSGAAALCYEVVWSRALSMTIGSSIYSFAQILETFLVGIAAGSVVCGAFLVPGRHRLHVAGATAVLLGALVGVPWGIEHGVGAYCMSLGATAVPVGLAWWWVARRARGGSLAARSRTIGSSVVGAGILLWPAVAALIHPVSAGGHLSGIVAAVVGVVAVGLSLCWGLARFPVVLIALMQLLIAAASALNYLFLDEIPLAFAQMVTSVEDLPNHVGQVFVFMRLTAGLCTLPAAVGMGAMFPLTVRVWTAGGGRIGRDVGVVYGANTLGSILGAWLPGFILMPLRGMEETLHWAAGLNLVLCLVMVIASAVETDERKTAGSPGESAEVAPRAMPIWQTVLVYILAPLIPALIALGYFHYRFNGPGEGFRWNPSRMTLGVFRVSLAEDALRPDDWGEPEIVFYRDGLSTTVSVEKWGKHYALKNNGKVDASNGDDMPTQIMVAGLPLLLHAEGPEALDVAIVGFGSGVTVGTALQFPVRSVDVVELERSIPEASKFFADVNHLRYPLQKWPFVQRDRLRVINDDGRNHLASTDRQYDVIVSEPSNPWITGVSDLFTADHFQITKRALKPGGMYCQWVQLYELSPENIKTIYRTFASQFRHVMVFSADDLSSDTILLGSDSPVALDMTAVGARLKDSRIARELERAKVDSPYDIAALTLLGSKAEVTRYAQLEYRRRGKEWKPFYETANGPDDRCGPPDCRRRPAPLNTDDNALIEFAAPRDLIGFERYENYLSDVYSEQWPYGRLDERVVGLGSGEDRARALAELALTLVAHGRRNEAATFIERSFRAGPVHETRVAVEVLELLVDDGWEPRIRLEPPVAGPQLGEAETRQLAEGFEAVRTAVDRRAHGDALAAMEAIPGPLRLHSGAALRFLYGYLLHKNGEHDASRYQLAIDQLEDVVRSEASFVRAHPEVHFFLAKAHDAEFQHAKALYYMRKFVETRVVPTGAQASTRSPPDAGEPSPGSSLPPGDRSPSGA